MKSKKKRSIYIIGILLFIIVAAILTIVLIDNGAIYEVKITEDQINNVLEEQFPVSETYLNIMVITLESGSAQLTEGSDRMLVSLNASVALKDNGTGSSFTGTIDVSTGVGYNPETGEVFLIDPVVDSLRIDNFPEEHLEVLTAIVDILVGEVLDGFPVYVLEAEDIPTAIASLFLKDVRIADGYLVLTFGL
jgi:hypothetical protein